MSTPPTRIDPVRKHRREVRYQIMLPVFLSLFGLLAFGVLLLVGAAAGSVVSDQISVIMGLLFTVFIGLPLVILCLLPYALLAGAAVGAERLYAIALRPLRATRRLTTQIALKTDEIAPKMAAPFAAFNLRVTRWEHTLLSLQEPETPDTPRLRDET